MEQRQMQWSSKEQGGSTCGRRRGRRVLVAGGPLAGVPAIHDGELAPGAVDGGQHQVRCVRPARHRCTEAQAGHHDLQPQEQLVSNVVTLDLAAPELVSPGRQSKAAQKHVSHVHQWLEQ